ncbi:2-succinyl-5-enolpyruvyl-6-hydroxy-3-cyclohexene-1-carboxylic-acid synthase [Lusitaniella coriacea LEGE 07157]|uniref:2-succinyl-5-enolpyruvyl-6-hydroxy-3-cyclohexene-1-carboxylate synthase n=1 Tax=Lusitaniella coriacea LEGE 07157 TaxID=945747 RepID=A0A8J7E097_9CYAN|nr:2-succinyl-5-enolpyruvyl-6-hydroxy-3-cyclohexene-1-carboxylic-acid synthase [Lusitaniella coriacea]MBE9118111.1 2-succinyl-5-enolpyruvyl-6-hydroxy-3-cyclohexene-1-carboxylic-acid synthase [Lusitaniella coriacea LEGE 07157]
MPLDFRNTNTLWSSILVETLHRLGLTTAILCPGSRSTPLTVAFAQHPEIEAIPILDERSAAFFALGVAKRLGLPVVVVCTSGTAGANFFPAVIEARYSRVPLIVLTADRPPELRDCHAGQAIAQLKLYGDYPNWQAELALPEAKMEMLCYLRQTLVQAWTRSRVPTPGVVHLNIPFRDPLAPIPQLEIASLKSQLHPQDFFAHISHSPFPTFTHQKPFPSSIVRIWQQCDRGIIIAGSAQPPHPEIYCRAIANLSQSLGFPVLAEGLSPLRNYSAIAPHLISTYDSILRDLTLAQKLAPDIIIQIGELPISKQLRTWLSNTQTHRWVIDPTPENFDPLHGKTTHLQLPVEQIPPLLKGWLGEEQARYLKQWLDAETQIREYFDRTLAQTNIFFEGKIPWLLSQHLPPKTPLFIANSMPVRDVEYFWKPNNQHIQPFFNRGANGIDGTLSTAFGIAHRNQSSVLLTGDLALLHDTNGFLQRNKLIGSLTIVLINNQGGGIFEMLPISQFDPPFEEFFATPQNIDFSKLCLTYDIEYKLIESWHHFQQLINPLPKQGICLLELKTNRKSDVQWRKETFAKISQDYLS